MVYASTEPSNRPPSSTSLVGHSSSPAAQQRNSPPQQAVAIDSLQSIRESFHQRAISSKATNIILQSWSVGPQKQYAPYIKKWHSFCSKREVNSYNPPLNTVLDFLVSLHEQGLSYTTINTARSALSAVILPLHCLPLHERHLQRQPTYATVPHYMGCKPSPFLFVIVVQANRIKSEILDFKTVDVNCTCLCSKRTESPHVRHPVYERRGYFL